MSKPFDNEKVINFIEELSWLLTNYNSNSLHSDISKFVKNYKQSQSNFSSIDEIKPENPNIAYLVGVLPSLFMNRNLFPKNEDIVLFAERVLKVNISRPEKRSQYELIGRIMCEVTTLDDKNLIKVVNELKRYSPSKIKSNELNWNDVIRRLSGDIINE